MTSETATRGAPEQRPYPSAYSLCGPFCYTAVDVVTSPPTILAIVRTAADAAAVRARSPEYIVTFAEDMEDSKGWVDAQAAVSANPTGYWHVTADSLSICFMHRFGHCRGRRLNDPKTCQQLHVRPSVLRDLQQRTYVNPERRYFLRSFTGFLPHEITRLLRAELVSQARQQAAAMPRRNGASDKKRPATTVVTELSFLAKDVGQTRASMAADAAFRDALHRTATHPVVHRGRGSATRMLQPPPIPLCVAFAAENSCAAGSNCNFLHASLTNVTDATIDPDVRRALRRVVATLSSRSSATPPPPLPPAGAGPPPQPLPLPAVEKLPAQQPDVVKPPLLRALNPNLDGSPSCASSKGGTAMPRPRSQLVADGSPDFKGPPPPYPGRGPTPCVPVCMAVSSAIPCGRRLLTVVDEPVVGAHNNHHPSTGNENSRGSTGAAGGGGHESTILSFLDDVLMMERRRTTAEPDGNCPVACLPRGPSNNTMMVVVG